MCAQSAYKGAEKGASKVVEGEASISPRNVRIVRRRGELVMMTSGVVATQISTGCDS